MVLEIDRAGEDDLLRRALEHQGWVGSQIHFLRKLYGPERVHPFREPRAVLLAPQFSPAFVAKLAELPVPITPLVFRIDSGEEEPSLALEAPVETLTPDAILPGVPATPADLPATQDAPPIVAERLTHEEMEAFYHFERRRLRKEKEGGIDS